MSRRTALERFTAYIQKTETCWLWTGYLGDQGYGVLGTPNGNVRAHRYSYELTVGPVPDGLVLDHLCRNRACVNPEHLEPVTNRENILRGFGATARNARKTHCIHGHEFTPENTRYRRGEGSRRCMECHRRRNRAAAARVAARAAAS